MTTANSSVIIVLIGIIGIMDDLYIDIPFYIARGVLGAAASSPFAAGSGAGHVATARGLGGIRK